MKRIFFAALLACALAAPFFAKGQKLPRGGQTLFEPRHWIYDALQILEEECAIVQFSDQAPITLNQVRAMLLEIDEEKLSEAGKIQYNRILDYFTETNFEACASVFQARIEPEANLEFYVKTNKNVPWMYDRYEKRPFLYLPVTLGAGDWVTLFADISVSINKTAKEDPDTFFNIPHSEPTFDVNLPHNAYGSFGYAITDTVGFNIRVSNIPEAFGRADTGSILQSGRIMDATSAAISIYSPIAQYTGSLTQLNTKRYLYAHKVDARIAKKVQISFMEAALPYGNLDLRFFNPMMFLHNYTSWLDYTPDGSDVGSYLGIKLNAAPMKCLRFFALWSMTQFQLPTELGDDNTDPDNYVPNAMGMQGGLESYIPIKRGHLHLDIDGYYANPYLYINSSPNWSMVKTSGESNSGSSDFYEWLGTKYGPDTAAASFRAEYEVPEKWSAGFKYLFLARGEFSDSGIFTKIGWGSRIFDLSDEALSGWVYPYITASDGSTRFSGRYKNGRHFAAPTGIPEWVNAIAVYGSFWPARWLKLAGQASLAFVSNSGHVEGNNDISFECVLGAQVKFTKLKKENKNNKAVEAAEEKHGDTEIVEK